MNVFYLLVLTKKNVIPKEIHDMNVRICNMYIFAYPICLLWLPAPQLHQDGPNEDVIGIGVLAQGRGRLATLTAHFDAISRTAWQGGLRKAAWKEPLSDWL